MTIQNCTLFNHHNWRAYIAKDICGWSDVDSLRGIDFAVHLAEDQNRRCFYPGSDFGGLTNYQLVHRHYVAVHLSVYAGSVVKTSMIGQWSFFGVSGNAFQGHEGKASAHANADDLLELLTALRSCCSRTSNAK